MHRSTLLAAVLGSSFTALAAAPSLAAQTIDLPSSKQLLGPAPGDPRRINSVPSAMALSPDGKWVLALNTGYGTKESSYEQSVSVLNTATGEVKDYPDVRTLVQAKQAFFEGLAFSPDGTKVYVSLGSTSDADGDTKPDTGNGIVVYNFNGGALEPSGFFKIPVVKIAAGKHSTYLTRDDRDKVAIPFPAGIAAVPGAKPKLLIAENLSDSVALMDAATGAIEHTFDLSESTFIPATYPLDVVVTRDGKRAFVSLWNSSEVAELDLVRKVVVRKLELLKPKSDVAPGTHPSGLLLDESAGMLYVALANRDAVAGLSIAGNALAVKGYFDTRLPGQSYFGAEPTSVAESADGSRLYVTNLGSDAVAVLDPHKLRPMTQAKGMVEPLGFVPTESFPLALVASGGKVYVASGKGKGTGPNDPPQPLTPSIDKIRGMHRNFTYAPTLVYGSLAVLDEKSIEATLKDSTQLVLESNRMKSADEKIQFASGANPIKHVIYIIKENRTYDQVFGDLAVNGKPVGNGDPKLAMYGADITPNQHKLVLQFGVLDNFYDSGEVSGEGHVWSNAAIGSDYLVKTWEINYRGGQRTYDYEGMVADGYPLLQHIPDVNEPASSYIWTDAAAHGKTHYNFGEYISSSFCGDKAEAKRLAFDPKQGAGMGATVNCAKPDYKPGEALPENWGGGTNLWPWPIPKLARNVATKPELVGHFAEESPDFNLRVPDQIRANVILRHLKQWEKDRAAGRDTMPNFIEVRMGNDHTSGTTPGGPTPKSLVADNDLAVGRIVDEVSHSAFWDDTAIFILEDDAQNGADHVDAHRSLGIVVSKYAPHAPAGQGAFVDSRFYSTVSVLRTMESLLGLPPMNNNDAFASLISTLFTGPGDQPAFSADTSNRDNGLLYKANPPSAPGARESAKMDFTHPDRAPVDKLNLILWQDAMGAATPPPPMLLEKHKTKKDADDN